MKSTRMKFGFLSLFVLAAGFALWTPASEAGGPATMKEITFSRQVAPIFYKSCAACHRAGEAAPFSVLSYKEVRPWAKSIRQKVASREMPPWHADSSVGRWANDPRLSQSEIDTIVAWVDGGAREGDVKDLPVPPAFTEGWVIGKPDVILSMLDEFTLDANGPDEYQYFDVPTNFKEDRWVQMAEARPGNRKVVHHILALIVSPGEPTLNQVPKEMRNKAMEMSLANTPFYRDGFLTRMKPDQPVYNDGTQIPAELKRFQNAEDFLTAYVPGGGYGVWEPGSAKRIPAGSSIRFQVHYSKVAGTVEKDRSKLGLIFAKEPPRNLIKTRAVANVFFEIPRNAEHHKVTAVWTPSLGIAITTLMPHMHYRGAAMEYKVFYADGRSEVLLNVPNYSFNWQLAYVPRAPIRVPAGSRIEVTAYFDNSARNKANPDPSKVVRYGDPTYDEMMGGFIDYVVEKPPSMAAIDPKVLDSYVGKYDLGNGRIYSVSREGNRFFGHFPNNPQRELSPESQNRFVIPEVESLVTFIRNEKGEVVELTYDQDERVTHAKRINEATTSGK